MDPGGAPALRVKVCPDIGEIPYQNQPQGPVYPVLAKRGGNSEMRLVKLGMLLIFAAALVCPLAFTRSVEGQGPTEAPADYDTFTSNGLTDPATFAADKTAFDAVDDTGEGLGPIYNAQSCRECHQNPISGGISQVTELRCGHEDNFGNFVAATVTINDGATVIANRSLINDRAICPGIVTDAN